METCPCGSGNDYKSCCEVFHSGAKDAPTAEILMRSRYSAFATNKIKYIGQTHVPGTEDFDEKEAQDWAVNSTWNKLEIVDTEKGQEADDDGMVEFKAFYSDKEGNDYVHHEISTFKKMDGKWLYGSGQIVGTGPLKRLKPKVGRNEPCPCGSEKKFKKCCGANK
jgi:SEC-C motif-containing protein